MPKLKIFFNQKPLHRERQADTAKFAAKFFDVISPLKQAVNNLTTHKKQEKSLVLKTITFLIANIPIINLRKMSSLSEKADIIYTWGDIPLFPKKPYMVELDNPYVLTLYNAFAFRLYRPIIKRLLMSSKCHKIVCISDACRKSLIRELGNELASKTIVLYPRIREESLVQRDNSGKFIHFLFVGLAGKSKGLPEALAAFNQIKNDSIIFNIIGFHDPVTENQYRSDPRIIFLGKLPREEILNKYMPNCDVLLFPTYLESFGMVALEALSRGMSIITTNIYALPEMVIDGYNGRVLPHPFYAPNKDGFVDIQDILPTLELKLGEQVLNSKLKDGIVESIEQAILNYPQWRVNSSKIYEEKFSEKAWENSFTSLFE